MTVTTYLNRTSSLIGGDLPETFGAPYCVCGRTRGATNATVFGRNAFGFLFIFESPPSLYYDNM